MDTYATVAICTANRPSYLADLLGSLRDQTCDPARFEILVVDNGQGSEAEYVTMDHCSRSGIKTRYVKLPIQSLSLARNYALNHFSGDILAFLDDDVLAEPEWLERLLEIWSQYQDGSVGAVGGKILPHWEDDTGAFYDRKYWWLFSLLDYSEQPIVMRFPDLPFGANFAVSRQAIALAGKFDERLGRKGNSLLSGEEMVFLNDVRSAGLEIVYTPLAVVQHRVSSERLTPSWILRRAECEGVGLYIMSNKLPKGRRLVRTLRKFVEWGFFSLRLFWGFSSRTERFDWRIEVAMRRGYLKGVFAKYRNVRPANLTVQEVERSPFKP
ncbi:MAG: hypothetical protein C7B46_10100 [Sulfobacillus benefaciens]|uniref:Glycosyltransferase 2-like domain-containing protein n=1 Tax=Sulfobacillus benefaciens TaxID=453960 RepID=A0A2T2XFY3_9FIRM|nr:MAG: hypothetical protein C7B46_10100 [Sulfobacillus benefaciens]